MNNIHQFFFTIITSYKYIFLLCSWFCNFNYLLCFNHNFFYLPNIFPLALASFRLSNMQIIHFWMLMEYFDSFGQDSLDNCFHSHLSFYLINSYWAHTSQRLGAFKACAMPSLFDTIKMSISLLSHDIYISIIYVKYKHFLFIYKKKQVKIILIKYFIWSNTSTILSFPCIIYIKLLMRYLHLFYS